MRSPRSFSWLFVGWIAAACVLNAGALSAQDTPSGPGSAETAATLTAPAATPVFSASPTPPPRLLYPSNSASTVANGQPGKGASTTGLATTFVVLVGLCAGAYYFSRRHPGLATGFKGTARKLNVSESRSLGNRQFLVVVEYEDARMLLGVTPGKIDYLCPLRGPQGEPAAFSVPKN